MKKLSIIALLSVVSFSAAANDALCVTDGVIKAVEVGDNNRKIKVQVESHFNNFHKNITKNDNQYDQYKSSNPIKAYWLKLDENIDIDAKPEGMAYLQTVLFAKATVAKVILRDQHGSDCDDWNRIIIE
ncbi:hypothetical protein [Zooshikella sp. RANM57]|uniref:hypothetical protein n=1 Tax=Zooshikella sp. RANM57 TaxID=3425863 RepID=UPI003D6FA60E